MPLSPILETLASRCGRTWPTMAKAAGDAPQERLKLTRKIVEAGLAPADASVVVFGSLARGEWTQGSDLDWTLLVDGPTQAQHAEVARAIVEIVAGQNREPGSTGVFGGLTFSHDLVHFIGGEDDTNTNTTRRILLLLESNGLTDDHVRTRVVKALLARYVQEDVNYHEPSRFLVPRFLLNDYVRYWRTMCVDSAQKRKEKVDKWALRNIKLRLSRKLIFTTGLWACLSCHLHPSEALQEARSANDKAGVSVSMIAMLERFSQISPLETLADAFMKYDATEAATRSFDAYEEFLTILDDTSLERAAQETEGV